MDVFFFVKIPRTHLSKFSCSCQFCFNLEDGEDNPCKHNTIFDLNERIYKQNSLRKIQLLVCLLECCIFASRRCLSKFRPNPVHTVIFSSSREFTHLNGCVHCLPTQKSFFFLLQQDVSLLFLPLFRNLNEHNYSSSQKFNCWFLYEFLQRLELKFSFIYLV